MAHVKQKIQEEKKKRELQDVDVILRNSLLIFQSFEDTHTVKSAERSNTISAS